MCDDCWDKPSESKVRHEKGSVECVNSKLESVLTFMLLGFKSIIQNDDEGKNYILDMVKCLDDKSCKISSKICEFEKNKRIVKENKENKSSNESITNILKENNEIINSNYNQNSTIEKLVKSNTIDILHDKKMTKIDKFKWQCVTDTSDIEIIN